VVSDGRRVAAPRPRKRKFWKPVGGWGKTRVPFWAYHWKDGDTETIDGVKYTFDAAAADKVCRFFSTYIRHFEGEHKGKRFILEPWQRCVARCLFGWKEADSGLRRFRRAFIFVPRKNGKSYFAAGIALYLTMADGESGAQVYSAASDRTQAAHRVQLREGDGHHGAPAGEPVQGVQALHRRARDGEPLRRPRLRRQAAARVQQPRRASWTSSTPTRTASSTTCWRRP
jgi:hypothetical protein